MWKFEELLEVLGSAKVIRRGKEREFSGFWHDSRTISPGKLFVALKGEKTDGHRFVKDALDKGASGALVEKSPEGKLPESRWIIAVKDTREALRQVGKHMAERMLRSTVAVTGSVGKTTTKELIAHILSAKFSVFKTPGNFNTDIGIPIALSEHYPSKFDFGVIEVAARKPGDISSINRWLRYDVAVLTKISKTHLEFFGSVEGVAKEKNTIFLGMKEGGIAVVNADDPYQRVPKEIAGKIKVVTFGKSADASLRLLGVKGSYAVFLWEGIMFDIYIGRFPEELWEDLCAGVVVGLLYRIEPREISQAMASLPEVPGRLRTFVWNGNAVIDDSYNANPESFARAFEKLSTFGMPKIAVVGDMLELGDVSKGEHRALARVARTLGIDEVWTVGELAKETSEEFERLGGRARHFGSIEEVWEALKSVKGKAVLIKGSHGTGLWKLVERMIKGDS